MTDEFLKGIPPLSALQQRFEFIKNATLKENVTVYFRYIILLLAMSEDKKLDSLTYSVYKDIVIYTASIVEAILEYAVKQQVANGKADDTVFGFTWRYSEVGVINHDCNEFRNARFCVAKKEQKFKWSARELDFIDINKAAQKAGILDRALHKKAEDLREKRNLIHLGSLDRPSDDYLKKKDVEAVLSDAHDIILSVENLLKST